MERGKRREKNEVKDRRENVSLLYVCKQEREEKRKNKWKHKNYFLLLLYPYEVGERNKELMEKLTFWEPLKVKIGYWHF